jgi:acetoacetate decarboxylase
MSESTGFDLKGESAPFTATGRSGMAVAQVPYSRGSTASNQVGHRGLVATWATDPDAAAALLPTPLQPDESTARVCLVITECQAARSADYLFEMPPQLVGWYEAAVLIPCSYDGLPGLFSWVRYASVDHVVTTGLFRGLSTKLASFAATLPFAGQPGNREMAVGNVAAATASRFDSEVFNALFECTAHAPLGNDYVARLSRQFGVRFMPDWMTPGGAPLVDDLVVWDFGGWRLDECWSGTSRVRVSDSIDEELSLLAPRAGAESYYVEFEYSDGPGMCRQLHDYRAGANGRRAASGGALKGASPPFTPSGMASLGRSTNLGGEEGEELSQAGHVGIYLNWRVDPEKVAQIIPWPLEVIPESERVWLFMNQTQSGINRHNVGGSRSREWLSALRPHHINWHEAMFRIPCAYQGELGYLLYVQYKDRDHSIYLGVFDGFTTKLADFSTTFPMAGHPFNREMAPGSTARIVLSRFNERIMTAEFSATRELARDEIEQGDINIVGLRHFPDYTGRGKAPLVHDIVNWHMVNRSYSRAWVGDANITFGKSTFEELYLLEPVEMLPSLFVYLEYQAGPGTAQVVHDYLTGRQAEGLSDVKEGQTTAPRYQR